MKNYKKYIGCLSLSVLTLIGCEDLKFGEKFLDKPISNEQNIDSVFNKKVYAEQALAETYHSLPDYLPMQGRLGYGVLEMLTDLGDWTKKGAPKFYTGTVDGTNTYLEHLPYRLDVASATIGVGRRTLTARSRGTPILVLKISPVRKSVTLYAVTSELLLFRKAIVFIIGLLARKVEPFSYGFIMIGFPIPKSSNIIFHSSALFWMAFTQLS